MVSGGSLNNNRGADYIMVGFIETQLNRLQRRGYSLPSAIFILGKRLSCDDIVADMVAE
jgi:hypothetical protein